MSHGFVASNGAVMPDLVPVWVSTDCKGLRGQVSWQVGSLDQWHLRHVICRCSALTRWYPSTHIQSSATFSAKAKFFLLVAILPKKFVAAILARLQFTGLRLLAAYWGQGVQCSSPKHYRPQNIRRLGMDGHEQGRLRYIVSDSIKAVRLRVICRYVFSWLCLIYTHLWDYKVLHSSKILLLLICHFAWFTQHIFMDCRSKCDRAQTDVYLFGEGTSYLNNFIHTFLFLLVNGSFDILSVFYLSFS